MPLVPADIWFQLYLLTVENPSIKKKKKKFTILLV